MISYQDNIFSKYMLAGHCSLLALDATNARLAVTEGYEGDRDKDGERQRERASEVAARSLALGISISVDKSTVITKRKFKISVCIVFIQQINCRATELTFLVSRLTHSRGPGPATSSVCCMANCAATLLAIKYENVDSAVPTK